MNLENTRHSLAHLLGASIMDLYPDAKLTLGPAIEDGFYYDVKFTSPLSSDDLGKIENKMREILPSWKSVTHKELSKEEALDYYKDNEFKTELINEISEKGEKITLYTMGDFTDLCRGGHTDDLSAIDPESFKLDRIAGAYWRGNEKNPALTRIYGLAFESGEKLQKYLHMREEAAKRDHRILGEQLDLFHFDESIGKGLPIWLPKGNIIKEELEKWAKETEEKWGYQRVTTPIITKENLFYTSGHLPLYKDSMYAPITIEEENYYIKPMNCPFHHKTFAARPKSYRDLPVRLAEYGWCHRYEDSGSLFGLMRVRGMQMNDAHIYVQKEKAVEEFVEVIKLHEYYYKILGIENYEMELALRDPKNMEKYHGNEEDWKDAERMTIEAMEKSGVPYKVVHEGAAFYGPKMDFQVYSSIGRLFTASTNQLDLYMGKQFNLEYTDSDGQRKVPAIIHRAPLGTHERFIGFLIEHYAGAFPVWLSPLQVAVLPVGEMHEEYANEITKVLKGAGIRVESWTADGLGKRIRKAKVEKVPYQIVIGDKERDSKTITVEGRNDLKLEQISLEEFKNRILEEIKNRKDV
ncbi:threonine--tRNA ligase [Candidatus Nomurabacteria bacterium]|nr:threonine--tRNA ligase [Candidatus Nomurabacteria bacterium]